MFQRFPSSYFPIPLIQPWQVAASLSAGLVSALGSRHPRHRCRPRWPCWANGSDQKAGRLSKTAWTAVNFYVYLSTLYRNNTSLYGTVNMNIEAYWHTFTFFRGFFTKMCCNFLARVLEYYTWYTSLVSFLRATTGSLWFHRGSRSWQLPDRTGGVLWGIESSCRHGKPSHWLVRKGYSAFEKS